MSSRADAAARTESTSVALAANASGASSTATGSVVGLSVAFIQAMLSFPVNAYRDGHRAGRAVLS